MRILLVEDDGVIAQNVATLLVKQTYAVDLADTIEAAELKIFEETYDCIILDRGLPDGDSLMLVPDIRVRHPDASVIMLTAKHRPEDVISGLNAGADDYLPKPFLPDELIARVRALLRRSSRKGNAPELHSGTIVLNTVAQTVSRNGKHVDVSPREYAVLEYLMTHQGEAIDRQQLLEHVWGETADMFSNTVDVHIRYLRKKLDIPGQESFIKTVKGKGYRV